MRPRRILFVQTAFLGDVVFSTALLGGISELFADAAISVLASPRAGGILGDHPGVEEIILYDKRGDERGAASLVRLVRSLRRRNFDLVVSPHRSWRSALVTRFAGAPHRLGFRSGPGRVAFNMGVPFPAREKRPYRRELALLEELAPGSSLRRRPALFVREESRREIEDLFNRERVRRGRPVVAFVPGTVWPTKRWPLENFLLLGKALATSGGAEVIVIGGPSEEAEASRLSTVEGVRNLVGRTSLRQLPALLSACSAVIAADTGPLHAAMALSVPVVALFGPTDERQFEFSERDVCHSVPLSCRPCSPHGGKRCPVGDWRCMPGIEVGDVKKSLMKILNNN